MADDHNRCSNIDSLVNKLLTEISRDSEEDFSKQTIQSTTLGLELASKEDHDIDKEITELEALIKRLQAEIVEMSETAKKPVPSHCPGLCAIDKKCVSCTEANYALPEISSQAKPENDGFPIISNEDGILEQQVKMFAENISNILKASNNTNPQKDDLDEVRRNFNVLWDDTAKNNIDLNENSKETMKSKLSTEFNYCVMQSSLEVKKPMFLNNISVKSIKSIGNETPIETSENVSEFCEGASPNDVNQKLSADNKLLGNSIDSDDISRSVNELTANNIINNFAAPLSAEPSCNLPGSIENHSSSTIDTTVSKDANINLLKLENIEAAQTPIIITSEAVPDFDNSCTADTLDIKNTPNETSENTIPKTDSILKSLNSKIRKIVGKGSENSTSEEKHTSEDSSDKDVSSEFWKAFPRSKSEPNKNFSKTSDDDSSINDPKYTTSITRDSPKNVIEAISNTINTVNFKTSNLENSNIKAAKTSFEIINIVKKVMPKFVSNTLLANDADKSKPLTENPSDTNTATSLSTERDPSSINYIRANLTTAAYYGLPINTPNGPQTISIENINDTPTPDVTKKNPEVDSPSSYSSSVSSAFPKFFGSNIQTGERQENVLKVEVTEEADEQRADTKKEEQDVEAEEVDDDNEEDDQNEDDSEDDDDDNTDDVD